MPSKNISYHLTCSCGGMDAKRGYLNTSPALWHAKTVARGHLMNVPECQSVTITSQTLTRTITR